MKQKQKFFFSFSSSTCNSSKICVYVAAISSSTTQQKKKKKVMMQRSEIFSTYTKFKLFINNNYMFRAKMTYEIGICVGCCVLSSVVWNIKMKIEIKISKANKKKLRLNYTLFNFCLISIAPRSISFSWRESFEIIIARTSILIMKIDNKNAPYIAKIDTHTPTNLIIS